MKNMDSKINWKSLGRVMIFIDGANVIYSLRDLGWKIDYKRLQKYFQLKTKLEAIYFYSSYFENQTGWRSLLDMLSRKGFIVRSKLVKSIQTQDRIIHKANCDVELTMDAMIAHRQFDTAILMSGDSDFSPLIHFLRGQKKQVIVISTRGHISKELIEIADYFLYFNKFKVKWQMLKQSKNPAKRGSR